MPILLPNGKSQDMKTCAVCVAYRRVIPTLERIAFAECRNRNWKKDALWSVFIAAVEVVPDSVRKRLVLICTIFFLN